MAADPGAPQTAAALDPADPVALACALIQAESVTPDAGSALDVAQTVLTGLGFTCHRLTFADDGGPATPNLFARRGAGTPCLAFAGHTDVVAPGDAAAWSEPPFAARVVDGALIGRGACDMKGGVAASLAACARYLRAVDDDAGALAFILTGDEEGVATNGTVRLIEWLRARGERIDACVLPEPTCPEHLGDMIKIGRRGSCHASVTVTGTQGHTAYPHKADNPIHRAVGLAHALIATSLDDGSATFQPSNLQLTSFDVGNTSGNIIPARAHFSLNIRYNDRHSAESLRAHIERVAAQHGARVSVTMRDSGAAFVTAPGPWVETLQAVIREHTGRTPELSASGGTSDARFIKDLCPVVEFGLVGATMHQIDERVSLTDLEALTALFAAFLPRYFAG